MKMPVSASTRILFEAIVSHHPPSQAGRTLRLPLGWGRSVRICARCTGQLIGAVIAVVCVVRWHISPLSAIVVGAACPLPGILDWTTQALCLRESCNALRLVTGAMFAFGCTIVGWQVFSGSMVSGALGLLAVGIQAASALWILRRCGAIERILDELEREAATLNAALLGAQSNCCSSFSPKRDTI